MKLFVQNLNQCLFYISKVVNAQKRDYGDSLQKRLPSLQTGGVSRRAARTRREITSKERDDFADADSL